MNIHFQHENREKLVELILTKIPDSRYQFIQTYGISPGNKPDIRKRIRYNMRREFNVIVRLAKREIMEYYRIMRLQYNRRLPNDVIKKILHEYLIPSNTSQRIFLRKYYNIKK